MDASLVQLGVSERLLDRLEGAAEEIRTEFLKTGASDACVEVNTLVEGVDLNISLGRGGERALGALTGGAETTDCALVVGDVLLVLALELLG